jgi:hypothetical protein
MGARSRWPVFAALLLGSMLLDAGATAEKDAAQRVPRFFLEVYGGFSTMRPDDLNLMADYYNADPLFFYGAQYDYLHAAYGDDFSYSVTRSGDESLKRIGHGFPWGIRARYALSRSISLSLSLDHVGENRLSGTALQYRISDRSQGPIQTTPRTVDIDYSDFFLGVSAWVPQVGIQFGTPLGENWRLGGSLSAGVMLARCRSVLETHSKSEYDNGYWSENFSLLEMKGSGTGLAADVQAEIRRRISRRLSSFLACGFAWRRAADISGPGRSQSLSRDKNAVQDLVENNWEGRWQKKEFVYLRNWGEFRRFNYGNYFAAGDATEDFVLDLSGFQVKAGLAWAF